MLTRRKYRLEFTSEQAEFAETIGAICRSVWNTGLQQRREYRRRGAWINYFQQSNELTEAKQEHEWLKAAPSHTLHQTLMDLDHACRQHGTWRIKWRSGKRWSPSFRFPDPKQIVVQRIGRAWGRCKLPKLGWVRFRWSRSLGGGIRSATVMRDGQDWYVSFLVQDGIDTPAQPSSRAAVGVDRGVVVAVACSDGTMRNRAFLTPGEVNRHRRLQQRLARQQRGSANRRKTISAMNRLRRRERDRRRDFVAWTANRLVAQNGLVVLEDLKTRSMTASARGTAQSPGRGVARKAGLNRSIRDKGWYLLEEALCSAARYTGTRVIRVPAAYTSLTCSSCRSVDRGSRKSQAVFRCTSCGHEENADLNAAKNILAAGLAVTACGDLASGRSVKQEPAERREALPQQPAAHVGGWTPNGPGCREAVS